MSGGDINDPLFRVVADALERRIEAPVPDVAVDSAIAWKEAIQASLGDAEGATDFVYRKIPVAQPGINASKDVLSKQFGSGPRGPGARGEDLEAGPDSCHCHGDPCVAVGSRHSRERIQQPEHMGGEHPAAQSAGRQSATVKLLRIVTECVTSDKNIDDLAVTRPEAGDMSEIQCTYVAGGHPDEAVVDRASQLPANDQLHEDVIVVRAVHDRFFVSNESGVA